ncbi:hypothetical protein DM02DRAFT_564599 [Periconia macrospinosa]|uniref:Uncharacterized protein n=1 Tax=Periconia macrospinosa TaxID=97972 RepID=A0A2V1DNL2_9PLEO|nr:hypothetical protein DM02DRAFT_564599 [Periconia macrospinosa]
MRRLRQTHLGGTATDCLTIVDLASSAVRAETSAQQHSAPSSARKPYILQLPDEILIAIVKFAARKSSSGALHICNECLDTCRFSWDEHATRPWDYHSLQTLSLVCRRFTKIAQPQLFRTIHFRTIHFRNLVPMVPPTIAVRRLYNTLRQNPHFQQHCRSISIYIKNNEVGDGLPNNYIVANHFARCLTRIRCLKIYGGFENRGPRSCNESTWALIRLFVAYCRDIEHLQISRWGSCLLPLDLLFKWLDFPKLKALSVHGISHWEHGRLELEPRMRRTAPFTSLIISSSKERLEGISLLIQWPALLTRVHFSGYGGRDEVMDYSTLEKLLLIHKDTLKYIAIQYIRLEDDSRVFNATLFPNLEFLELSRWDTHPSSVHFRADDVNVLGPKLKTFCWNFNVGGYESWTAFDEASSLWISNLANATVACNAALRRIELRLCPRYSEPREETIYPWDLIDDLRDKVLRPKGIDLSYNDPPILKEKWREYLDSFKREALMDEGVDCSSQSRESSLASEEDQSTESSEQAEYKGGYEGEDLRKYFIST